MSMYYPLLKGGTLLAQRLVFAVDNLCGYVDNIAAKNPALLLAYDRFTFGLRPALWPPSF